MVKPVRKIVTGNNSVGRSIVVDDKTVTAIVNPLSKVTPDAAIISLWQTNSAPAQMTTDDPTKGDVSLMEPPPSGTVCQIIDIPPDETFIPKLTDDIMAELWGEIGSEQKQKNVPHPLMHITKTVDYIVILSGEIYLVLEEEETLLRAGDVVIQRGTNHAWSNRSKDICRFLAVLIDAENQSRVTVANAR